MCAVSERASHGGAGSSRRIAISYVVLVVGLVAAIAVSLGYGLDEHAKPELGGAYVIDGGSCLSREFTVMQSGSFATVDGSGGSGGDVRVAGDGRVHGTVRCLSGESARLSLLFARRPAAKDGSETGALRGLVGGRDFAARGALTTATTKAAAKASAKPAHKRSGEETFGRLMAAIAAAILAARLVGLVLRRVGQPQVMGEVLAGVLLGPSLLGAIAPGVENAIFPADIIPLLTAGADIGLAFYLFLVGLEFDPLLMRGRIALAALVSNASVAVPMALGFLAAIPLFPLLAPDVPYLPFALFSGLALSITAFPVLARILVERRMLRAPVGALALAAASVDDVTAWLLLALASATVAGTGSVGHVFGVLGLTVCFVVFMATVVRRALAHVSAAYDEAGHVPSVWMTAIFVGVLGSAFIAQWIGVAAIFGAFVFGVVMPRRADLSGEVTERLESFVVTVLLPLFFVVNGLKVDVSALGSAELWLIAAGILAVAVVGKWGAAAIAGLVGGMPRRDAIALGALMNTRGLTELLVLNIGLELGVITPTLFTILVLMALVTTLATGPALRLMDPKNRLASPPEEALAGALEAQRDETDERAILIGALDERNIDALTSLGAALAASQPPREIVLTRLLEPLALAVGTSGEQRALESASTDLERRRRLLAEAGVHARAAVFSSPAPGRDLVRLATEHDVDIVLVDGRRPLLGEGVPRGAVGEVLADAPCDVGVLVTRARTITIDAEHPVLVPFGGADHDWAALEAAAWLAASHGATLKLVGLRARDDDERDASRLLADASLVVQQMAGVGATPVLVDANARAMIEAVSGAGIVLLGLSTDWRETGLGASRALLLRHIAAPVLFVRRGRRPGALAGADGATRFSWSHLGLTGVSGPPDGSGIARPADASGAPCSKAGGAPETPEED
jgi:K+:H+ antiporter